MTDANEMLQDQKFVDFVDSVSPRHPETGIQPVFLAELITILQLLWELYQFFKDKGCFTKLKMRTMVKVAMKEPTRRTQEAALMNLRAKYVVQV